MSGRARRPKEVICAQGEGPRRRGFELASPSVRSAGQALEVLCAFPAKTSSERVGRREGGRRLGLRPALAARGHRGNYTPRCRRLPARPRISRSAPLSSAPLLGTAGSILASAQGKRGLGQLPLGTSRDFLHAARRSPQVAGASPPQSATRPTRTTALEVAVVVPKG